MSQSLSPVMPKPVTPARLAARWPLCRNPVRLAVSASPWRSAGYLVGYVLGSAIVVALAHVARSWRDPGAWRELGRAAGLWLPLAVLDTVGVFVDTRTKALISAGIGLAGFLACNYLVVAMARARAGVR
jgi:hypothetical protein